MIILYIIPDAAELERFLVNGGGTLNKISVNESDRVEFICEFDSDPVTTVSILNGTDILQTRHSNIHSATIDVARCEYVSRVYVCLGRNIHSTES